MLLLHILVNQLGHQPLTEERSKTMNSEVDINVLVTLYNQKLASLTNQNVLLEAKFKH